MVSWNQNIPIYPTSHFYCKQQNAYRLIGKLTGYKSYTNERPFASAQLNQNPLFESL